MYVLHKSYNIRLCYILYNSSLVRRLDATEARKRFSDLLNWVCFGGETVVVTRHGRDIAAVVPTDKAAFGQPGDKEVRLACKRGIQG